MDGIADLLAHPGREGNRPVVMDAAIGTAPVWAAAIEGRPLREGLQGGGSPGRALARQVSLLAYSKGPGEGFIPLEGLL